MIVCKTVQVSLYVEFFKLKPTGKHFDVVF